MNILDDVLIQKNNLYAEGYYQTELFILHTELYELRKILGGHFIFGNIAFIHGIRVYKSEYPYSYIEGTAPRKPRRRLFIPLRNTWFGLTYLEKESLRVL